ncbi:MAG: right-handed parallel beta-helix repeat-containing protein [Opitutaceae bacterium]|nr:right-handed parallel beta-helix repeat-containing protein [Opitutaceae bacterium]
MSRSVTHRARIHSLLLFLGIAVLAPAQSVPTFVVAPAPLGDDRHDGSAGAPFATLDRARLAVRARLAAREVRGDLVVELRAGTYELEAPVRFDAADSGHDRATIVYRAARGADVVLSGGRRVADWTHEGDGTYRVQVDRSADFRQLWVDDRRAVRARTPNVGCTFVFEAEKRADGFDLPRASLAGVAVRPNEIEISVLIAWMHKRLRIAQTRDAEGGALTRAVIAEPEWDAITNQPQGDRTYHGRSYWLENAREFLDAPGEFFLDRSTGVLRYRPRPGEDLVRAVVIRPELQSLIVLDGRPDAPVRHLRFEGLTFAHTGWTRPNRAGFVDVQANSLVPESPRDAVDPQFRHNQRKDRIPAAFQASTSDHVVIRGCRFVRLGGAGVIFAHGGDDNTIEGNSFFDLAAGGIELGEDAARPVNPRLIPRRNRIANNFLAHLGADYFGSVAILGYYTQASVITHNEMAALPYTAISQGWGWGAPSAPPESGANRITYNRVSNFLRRLDDGGGLYTTDRQPGSEIAFNFITRMTPPDDRKKAGAALYPDQFTEGTHWHDNVVSEVPRWLHLWNPNIQGNRIERTFSDTAAYRNDGPDNVVESVRLSADRRWPEPALAIMAAAGLEPAFRHARVIAGPSDVILESSSVDFQTLTGSWTSATRPGSYGAVVQHSPDANAAGRWMPIIPRDGVYEVSVWRPSGSAAMDFVILHAKGESRLAMRAGEPTDRWQPLGEFPFLAGAGGELIVSRAQVPQDTAPLMADAVRLRRMESGGSLRP